MGNMNATEKRQWEDLIMKYQSNVSNAPASGQLRLARLGSARHVSCNPVKQTEGVGMTRHRGLLPVLLAVMVALVSGTAAWAIRLEEARLVFEYNATDGDLGPQAFWDGDEWKSMEIFRPDGQSIYSVEGRRGFRVLGSSELFFESGEPSFPPGPGDPDVLALFPEGTYKFRGETVDGEILRGEATLSHHVCPAPVITHPVDGAEVSLSKRLVVKWTPGTSGAPGFPSGYGLFDDEEVVSYQLIIENEDLKLFLTIDIPAGVTSVDVPKAFLTAGGPGTEWDLEVAAIGKNGNRTLVEQNFTTVE
jgi:hypothetical protein